MAINFNPSNWSQIKQHVEELAENSLSTDNVSVGDTVRLINFEFDNTKASKCFDGQVQLDISTMGSWYFDKYSFFDTDMKSNKLLVRNKDNLMFVLRAY